MRQLNETNLPALSSALKFDPSLESAGALHDHKRMVLIGDIEVVENSEWVVFTIISELVGLQRENIAWQRCSCPLRIGCNGSSHLHRRWDL